ncbi:hypothetical protein HF086_008141 [Spodoptera exigua]|uniref:Uncharacterized protein n=1 Tax=Spodoptera exigua TaxID=7107 RepID=A0A922MMZ1_SPOEX|nr:hypothetical protein HF086_008141 [Spodoptera exigua]
MRTRDRLAELQHLASGAAGGVYCDTVQPGQPDAAAKHDAHIQDIFQEVRAAGRSHTPLHYGGRAMLTISSLCSLTAQLIV